MKCQQIHVTRPLAFLHPTPFGPASTRARALSLTHIEKKPCSKKILALLLLLLALASGDASPPRRLPSSASGAVGQHEAASPPRTVLLPPSRFAHSSPNHILRNPNRYLFCFLNLQWMVLASSHSHAKLGFRNAVYK
jgi:hypothetical protein